MSSISRCVVAAAWLGLAGLGSARAGEIGFAEQFGLAEDRAAVLNQLVPGNEDYYYYHCLQYQNAGDLDKARDVLDQWIKRYNYTGRVEELRNRQALLEYDKNPQSSLDQIKHKLDLRFDQQKQRFDQPSTYPIALDPDLISRGAMAKRAYARYQNLNGWADSGLYSLTPEDLTPDRRRDLIRRLQRPDYPDLPALVVADLQYKNSRGFGEFAIHRQLLLSQLDACLKAMPELLNNPPFVDAYLAKLAPDEDVRWEFDPASQRAYLDRLWAFAAGLPAVQNSLKAHLLYRLLVLDQSEGKYDKARFTDYLKLPRQVFYINRDYMQRREMRDNPADLNADFSRFTHMEPIANDEPLVRDSLEHFLLPADNYKEWAEYVDETYLKEVFAEVKLLNGIGDMEQWYSLLPPQKPEALKERVDLDFLPTNKLRLGARDPVALEVAVKNVATLIVKTYEINAMNYYQKQGEEISTAIDLDGLVANQEQVIKYAQTPLRRHVERFEFPRIDKAGVFVIELIGNGKSSRAVIRKGRHTVTERIGSAGHIFRVFDDADQPVKTATLWLAGHEYRADAGGEIAVPFSTQPGPQKVVIQEGDFATLHSFDHCAEEYALDGGILCDRESLIEGMKCKILIRPQLTVSGVPVDVGLLEEPRLTVESTDRDGVSTSKEIEKFALSNDREAEYEFRVPEKLASMTFTVKGRVENLSRNRKEDLSMSRTFVVNGMDAADKTEMLYLRHADGKYALELLGKNGEPRAGRAVQVEFKHRDFTDKVNTTLQTDAQGIVALGELKDIERLSATGPEKTTRTWTLARNHRSYPDAIHAPAGQVVRVALVDPAQDTQPGFLSLLEVRGGTFVRDCRDQVNVQDGFADIAGLTPGDYDLMLRNSGADIKLRITQGQAVDGYLLSRDRCLELGGGRTLQIADVRPSADGKTLQVQVVNATPSTRVHVVATRFLPFRPAFEDLGEPVTPELNVEGREIARCWYLSGRNIGDEYRYILERKYAAKLPGNMLTRPSLILNPWSLRKTQTGLQQAQAGEGWRAYGGAAATPAPRGLRERAEKQLAGIAGAEMEEGDPADMDFLPSISLLLANLRPDANGIVQIDRAAVGSRQELHVIAVDADDIVDRELSMPPIEEAYRDLRLLKPLDPKGHFAERKSVTCVPAGGKFTEEDISTAKIEVYDTLPKVFSLYSTLSGDATLAEFAFILDWPTLPIEKKKELYARYACHELNFFLSRKDPDFFKTAIVPYLANKKDKTFMDHWLLGDDLTPYLDPWAYGRLNVVEQALLGQRVKGQAESTARHVRDLYDLLTPDIERMDLLFMTALKGSALETEATPFNAVAEKPMQMPMAPATMLAAAAAPMEQVAQAKAQDAESEAMGRDLALGDKAARGENGHGLLEAGKAKGEARAATGENQLKADLYVKRLGEDRQRRGAMQQLYRKLDKTEEWVESNYYHLPIEQQVAERVTVNGFWKDYAANANNQPFLSANMAEASRNFTEMMLALAVLDLPFKAGEEETTIEGKRVTIAFAAAAIVVHKQIQTAEAEPKAQPILVSQNFFARNDRYRYEGNERFDKFVTDEFEAGRVYGCQVVLTNPTSTRRKLDVLLQIPEGAMPVCKGFETRSQHYQLEPFSTQSLEYYFYFPAAGAFRHFPVNVAQNEKFLAATEPFEFHVVDKLTKQDTTAWPYVSQNGSDADVLAYVRDNNVDRLDLDLIAFRMRDKPFFGQALELLRARHVYNNTLWSFSVFHNDVAAMREYLEHTSLADQCGMAIHSTLLDVDPVWRCAYQHKEYWPLVNARVYQLGRRRQILNQQFYEQYNAFLSYLAYVPKLGAADGMTVTTYMLLQDRVEEAERYFAKVKPEDAAMRVQYDYLAAYLDMYREKPAEAGRIAAKYKDYPVQRWQNLFQEVAAQVCEIEGKAPAVVDKEDRTQTQTQLAATSAAIDFDVENRQIALRYQSVTQCRINYYLMDIELLFSRNPFVQDVSDQFSIIRPNETLEKDLPKNKTAIAIDLPAAYRDRAVMVEIVAGGITKRKAYYPHSLGIQVVENYGQVRVTEQKHGQALPKVYVKVYARMKDGSVQFYKDGYTDLRGRFDYTSLSTDEIRNVDRFSLLIMSDENGAVVREAAPPKM